MKYERMLPAEIEQQLQTRPIAILPWGALEWHGYHLAVGQDALKAQGIADRCAEAAGAISLPVVWCGFQTMKPHAGFKHTLEFRDETVRTLAREYLEQLDDEGFKVIVIITGHYGPLHVRALKEVGEWYQQQHPHLQVWVLAEYEVVKDLGYTGDHAAKWETSIFWHLHPELTDISRFRTDLTMKEQGVGGENPSVHASPELGEMIVNAIAERVGARCGELLAEVQSPEGEVGDA